jgi:hypothetical protein
VTPKHASALAPDRPDVAVVRELIASHIRLQQGGREHDIVSILRRLQQRNFGIQEVLAYLEELAAARGIIADDLQPAGRSGQITCPRSTSSAVKIDSPVAVTDAEGNATISNLKTGKYVLRAGREGYLGVLSPQTATAVAPKSASLEVTVDSGIPASQVSLFLNPSATVSGRIVDASGAPVGNACVQLGQRKQQRTGITFVPGPRSVTDSKGEYRLQYVSPGEYVIGARAAQSSGSIRYLPGVAELEKATTLTIEAGSDTVSIDFKLP